jgi:hypothetical protein
MAKATQLIADKPPHSHPLAEIGAQVMHVLGRPSNLQKVQVRHLWDDCYRVNVLVGVDFASARFAHSYFLVVDEGGLILSSAPALARAY